jgi:hypothetical protein
MAGSGGIRWRRPPYDASRRRKPALSSETQSTAKEHFTASSVEEHRRTSTSSPTWPRFRKRGHFSWVVQIIIQVPITRRKYYSSATTALARQEPFSSPIDAQTKSVNAHVWQIVPQGCPPKARGSRCLEGDLAGNLFSTLAATWFAPRNLFDLLVVVGQVHRSRRYPSVAHFQNP